MSHQVPVQRVIAPEVIANPTQQSIALDEGIIGDHLDRYLVAEDNQHRCRVFSAMFGGPHVYCFAPSSILNRNYWTLFTMGLSGIRMNVPGGIEDPQLWERAELFCYLPEDWTFPVALGVGEEVDETNWPLKMLRALVFYVENTHAWLANSHGIPNLLSENPGERFVPSSKLSHVILLTPYHEREELHSMTIGDNQINFYIMIPLTALEAQWKREVGAENSIYYIIGSKATSQAVMVDYVIDPARPCAVEDLNARQVFPVIEGDADSEEEVEEDPADDPLEVQEADDATQKQENNPESFG